MCPATPALGRIVDSNRLAHMAIGRTAARGGDTRRGLRSRPETAVDCAGQHGRRDSRRAIIGSGPGACRNTLAYRIIQAHDRKRLTFSGFPRKPRGRYGNVVLALSNRRGR